MQAILTATVAVALAEMGDKTQLLALSLAARFRQPWSVIGGIFVATVANHLLAASVGVRVAAWLGPDWMRWLVGGAFLAFAAWTLVPDDEPESAGHAGYGGAFATTAVLFFFAEMGDKTQLATVALAARHPDVIAVTTGTTAGMMISDGLAVFVGDRMGERLDPVLLRRVAAGLFAVLGVVTLIGA
ncbi:MAG TPA: TMEM165/GDT1 family protein [Myxococcota bacterium]|nr:TMEM165/GDT1 family protein [Myxococcota bacterium]